MILIKNMVENWSSLEIENIYVKCLSITNINTKRKSTFLDLKFWF